MTRRASKPKIHWEDRFEHPSLVQLLMHLPRQQSQLILQAREEILALGSIQDSIEWHGIPWRWALTFTIDGDPGRPWAYIIPQAGKPILSLPISAEAIGSLPARKLSKAVRDGILSASQVGDACWPQWDLTSKPLLEEIMVVVRHKHEMMPAASA